MAQLSFDSAAGIVIPETSDIREDIAEEFKQAFQVNPDDPELNTDPVTPFGQIIDLIVAEIEAKNSELAFLANMNNSKTATGRFLDALASLYGLSRKISEPTIVMCQCSGLQGTFIPYGAIVQDVNGNKFRCSQATGITIGSTGIGTGEFAALENGALIVSPNAVKYIITTIAGWDSVNNSAAGITGRTEETDAELRNRIYDSYAINSTGSAESLESNLAQLSGVIDVAVLENYTNAAITKYGVTIDPHSVAICISGGEDTEIASVIYSRKDIGCGTTGDYQVTYIDTNHANAVYEYEIIRPVSTNFYVDVVFFSAGISSEEEAAIKAVIISDFLGQLDNDRVKLASDVFSSRFYKGIQSITDIPIASLEIKLGSGSFGQHVTINGDVEPVLSEANITISANMN